ncbi:MAG TPA: cytochrome c [Bacteroidia bacterium]|nr:cytochrome c [Bacteroidia bacterium]
MKKGFVFLFLFSSFLVYSILVYTKGTKANGKTMSAEAVRGKFLYQKHNCTACHQIYGLGGYLGPDLTNAISANENSEIVAKALLKTGTQRMPDFHLNENEIEEIITYLKYIDETTVINTITE